MNSGAHTCSACLSGRPNRCVGAACAQWGRWSEPRSAGANRDNKPVRATVPGSTDATRRSTRTASERAIRLGSAGAPHGPRVPNGVAHAIALDLLHTNDVAPLIAERHSVKYEQVRTVKRNLEALAGHAFDRGLNGRGRIAA